MDKILTVKGFLSVKVVSKREPALPLPFQIQYLFAEAVFFPNLLTVFIDE